MILKIMDFLANHQYVEMVEWSKEYYKKNPTNITAEEILLLNALQTKNIEEFVEQIRKKAFTTQKNESYALIYDQIQQYKESIIFQWKLSEKLDISLPFVNLIVQNDIIIFQPKSPLLKSSIKNIKTLKKYAYDPNLLIINGEIYDARALSSIDNLHSILKESKIEEEFKKYRKYEKIVQFIENFNFNLQKLFSLNQIGIIIYENEIYLIKWVQFLNEQQILTGQVNKSSEVAVLEDFGVKIGIQLKENLELGDLVIFRNKDESKTHHVPILKPLLSLDQSIFNTLNLQSHHKQWNLTRNQDAKEFLDEILARIETGILLLSKDKSTFLNNPQQLDLYIKLYLQKVDGLDSVNQRINILRDLLKTNKNPDNTPKIIEKLEINYIFLLKQIFQEGNTQNIPYMLQTFQDLGLFLNKISLLLHTLVYQFEKFYVPSTIILESVILFENWSLSEELYVILEKPQIIAITNEVVQMLNAGKFSEVLKFLTQYMDDHPRFGSYNIITLLIQILRDIFRLRHQNEDFNFPNSNYIIFLRNFTQILAKNDPSIKKGDKQKIKSEIQSCFEILMRDVDFIGYLDLKLIEFLEILKNIDQGYLSSRFFQKYLQSLIELIPIVMFQKNLPSLGSDFFSYLTTKYKNDDLSLAFSSNYISFFAKSTKILEKNPTLLKKSTLIISDIKNWIQNQDISKIKLISIKKEIHILLKKWYLSAELPEHDFEIHKNLIHDWIDFVELQGNMQEMMNILYIKDFIWACDNYKLQNAQKKYAELPESVFKVNSEDLMSQMSHILSKSFSDYSQFQVFHQVFKYFQDDFEKLCLNTQKFNQIREIFIRNLQYSLKVIIHDGNAQRFALIMEDIVQSSDFIFLSTQFLEEIFEFFTIIHEMNIQEGERFNQRIEMMGILSLKIEKYLQIFQETISKKINLFPNHNLILTEQYLKNYVRILKTGSYQVFKETQRWLLEISSTDYLTYETTFKPLKNLFSHILEQFQTDQSKIKQDLIELSQELFESQSLLNDNKKKYFQMMLEILSQEKFPEFYPKLQFYSHFIDELGDIEALYFTIRSVDSDKIKIVQKRISQIIIQYPHLFTPHFIYANCLAIQENFLDAIKSYKKAMNYQSNQGNYARLYHNLLVAYLSTNNLEDAIKLVKSMDLGIKAYPHIAELIKKVEEKTGEHLLR